MTIKEQVLFYHNKGYSINQIKKATGYTFQQVHSVYSKFKGLSVNRYDLIEPKNDLIQLCIASLIGDGSFTKPYKNTQSSKLSIAHCIDQKELIEYKHTVLKSYNLEGKLVRNKIINNRYKKGYIEEYRFKSKAHPIFYHLRERYYEDGHKIIDKEYVKLLDPLGIAIWHMDDANITHYSFQLNTQGYSKKGKNILRSKLRQFGIRTTLHKQGQIYILAESKDIYIDLIKPYILPSMKYKLVPYKYKGPVINKLGELLEPPSGQSAAKLKA